MKKRDEIVDELYPLSETCNRNVLNLMRRLWDNGFPETSLAVDRDRDRTNSLWMYMKILSRSDDEIDFTYLENVAIPDWNRIIYRLEALRAMFVDMRMKEFEVLAEETIEMMRTTETTIKRIVRDWEESGGH